jgi:hypothetical protein
MNLEDVDLAHRIQCFTCGEFFMACTCQNQQEGENHQYMLNDEDMPPATTSFETNLKFWMRLVKLGQLTAKVNVDLFYQDQVNHGFFNLIHNADLKYQFYVVWDAYCQSEHFLTVVVPTFQVLGLEKLKRVGKEALDSYFSGRWWELSSFCVALVMNSLEICGPNPNAPTTMPMRMLADALQFVELVLKQVSKHQSYSLIASEKVSSMQVLAAFTRVAAPPQEHHHQNDQEISHEKA